MIYLERGLAHWHGGFFSWLDFVGRGCVAVEICPFRPSRLRRHHALGHSGRDPDGVGLSNCALKFFCKYSGNEASSMSHSSLDTTLELMLLLESCSRPQANGG